MLGTKNKNKLGTKNKDRLKKLPTDSFCFHLFPFRQYPLFGTINIHVIIYTLTLMITTFFF